MTFGALIRKGMEKYISGDALHGAAEALVGHTLHWTLGRHALRREFPGMACRGEFVCPRPMQTNACLIGGADPRPVPFASMLEVVSHLLRGHGLSPEEIATMCETVKRGDPRKLEWKDGYLRVSEVA